MKCIYVFLAAVIFSTPSVAALITIEPDDFTPGTRLTGLFSDVNLRTSEGGDVYASPLIGERQGVPPGFVGSGEVGNTVFSKSKYDNSEWILSSNSYFEGDFDEFLNHVNGALVVEFLRPVNSVSILSMELFEDAGWGGGSDPQIFWLFDSLGRHLQTQASEGPNKTILPGEISPGPDPEYSLRPFSHFQNSFSHADIGYLVVGGDSEPTSLGRIQYNTAEVSEPSGLAIFMLGILALILRKKG